MLAEAVERHHDSDVSRESAALESVQAFSERKERLPGYGHRVHTDDPRAQRLLALASAQNTAADGVSMARAIEAALAAQTGRRLPLNVDGAIAAVLLDIGIPASLGNAFFMMARLPGLIAHINEEQVRERKMRIIDPRNHSYDGPEDR
jgi:citrate synthase